MATIDHFMWGYQQHYRAGQRVAAEVTLQKLDARFRPGVFLVGILDSDADDRYPACVEPENDFWLDAASLDHVRDRAIEVRAGFKELLHSHPLAQQRADDASRRRSIRDAVAETIAASPARPPDIEFFVSVPERVGGYLVLAVLGLQRAVLESHHRLHSGELAVDKYHTWPVSRSLVDATVDVLLSQAARELQRPEPGLMSDTMDAGDTLRAAARRLAMHTAFRADHGDRDAILTVSEFFHTCNEISKLKYERKTAGASLLLARPDHPNHRSQLQFADPIPLRDHQRIRKLLELAPAGVSLFANGARVFGLTQRCHAQEPSEDFFEVRFVGLCHWDLTHNGRTLMSVRFGEPSLPFPSTFENTLRADLPRLFPRISRRSVSRIVDLAVAAEGAGHGVLFVVTDDAAGESKRLAAQGTPTVPTVLTPSLLEHLSRIDGAILMDRQARCYAIGAILDGVASSAGNPARGARYNSALKYVESSRARGTRCLAVVVSEDGGVSLVPQLRPAIPRADVDAALQTLEAAVNSLSVPEASYNDAYTWLREHRFYLLPADCERVNACLAEVEPRLRRDASRSLWIVREPLAPDSGMVPKLYYTN